jgi:hypothetical protein
VLGEVGRGHIIAFNILNLGRLTLGIFAHGEAQEVLNASLKYARERKAFGKSIGDFGLIQHKLAEMAARMFANESMAYRVTGAIQARLAEFSWTQPDAARMMLKSVEEFAAECSFVKIFGSEMLSYVVDEGVQIHGGYGYHQDYLVERSYRDARINRIFEGTNEINRLLATGMLLKRAQKGALPLPEAVKKLQAELLSGTPVDENDLAGNAKKIALFLLGVAYQKFGGAIEAQQEVVAGITDVLMNAYAMESALLRARRVPGAADLAALFAQHAMQKIEGAAREVLAACSEGDGLRTNLAVLRKFTRQLPLDVVALRRKIAGRLLASGRYSV